MPIKILGVLFGAKLAKKFSEGVAEGMGEAAGNNPNSRWHTKYQKDCVTLTNGHTGEKEQVCLFTPTQYYTRESPDTGEVEYYSRSPKPSRKQARKKIERFMESEASSTARVVIAEASEPRYLPPCKDS